MTINHGNYWYLTVLPVKFIKMMILEPVYQVAPVTNTKEITNAKPVLMDVINVIVLVTVHLVTEDTFSKMMCVFL